MKMLITGGAGFIGGHLVKKLKGKGVSVDVFDSSKGNDVTNSKEIEKVITNKYNTIFNLAGFSGSQLSNKEKLKSLEVNTFVVENICSAIIKHSPKTKLILSSSRLEYGVPQYLPVDEKHPTIPTSIYGLSKLLASEIALMHHIKNSLNVTVFRTSNVYGPHKNISFSGYNIINHFIDLAKEDRDLTIYGQGNQLRDYIYIDDLIKAFILASESNCNGEIYNLGFGKGIKFNEMAKLIIKKIGKGRLKFVKWPETFKKVETGSYISDIKKVEKQLGFTPKTSFEEGIKLTISDS